MMPETYAYIGTTACGCPVAVVIDDLDHRRETAKAVYEYIAEGLTIERVTVDAARRRFSPCTHQPETRPITGKHLYEVHLFGWAYVLAEDEEQAERIMTEHQHDCVSDEGVETVIHVATVVHHDWQQAFPYTADDDEARGRTCQDILDHPQALGAVDPSQLLLAIE